MRPTVEHQIPSNSHTTSSSSSSSAAQIKCPFIDNIKSNKLLVETRLDENKDYIDLTSAKQLSSGSRGSADNNSKLYSNTIYHMLTKRLFVSSSSYS